MWLGCFAPTILNTWRARLTRSRITIAFLVFVLANYTAQTVLHAVLLSGYSRDRELVTSAINSVGVQRGFTVAHHNGLEICYGIPDVHGTVCHNVVTNMTPATTNTLSVECAQGLTWLERYLHTTKTEEIVYLVFQSWLVMNSLLALLIESYPHLIVVLVAQAVNISWISYRLHSDASAKTFYNEIIVDRTCGQFDVLETWQHSDYYAALTLGIAAILGTLPFVFKLTKLYSNATLSSVGSPPAINQLLKWRLWTRVCHLFSMFFILTSALVWFEEHRFNMISSESYFKYDVGFYAVVIILGPWVVLGTYSITKEKRLLFLIYSFLSICLLLISGLWFGNVLYRYEYVSWRYFTCVTTLADISLVITCIVSIVCRINFGKGLAQFLDVEQALQVSGFAQDTFQHDPIKQDKVERPSFTSNRPKLLSDSALSLTNSSLEVSSSKSRASSSIESVPTVYAVWLSSQGGEDEEKGRGQAKEEQSSTITVSCERMSPHGVHSISYYSESDSGDKDDEKTVVS